MPRRVRPLRRKTQLRDRRWLTWPSATWKTSSEPYNRRGLLLTEAIGLDGLIHSLDPDLFDDPNGIAYPNDASAGNDQGRKVYTKDEASGQGGFICHVDNNRGASYCTVTDTAGHTFR